MPNSSLNFNFKSLLDWKGVLLVIFLIFLTFMQCQQSKYDKSNTVVIDGELYKVNKKTTSTKYIPNRFTEYRSKEQIYTFIVEYDTAVQYENVDTAEILKDYFAKKVSIDTLELKDSLGYVTLTDTIKENRIWYRTYLSNINQKEIHDTTWLTPVPTSTLYFGINGGFTKNQLPNTIGLSLMYQTPKNKIFGLGVGLQNGSTITPYVNGSVYWKIKLKK